MVYIIMRIVLSGFIDSFPFIQICAGLRPLVNSCTRIGVNSYVNRFVTFITQSIDHARFYLGSTCGVVRTAKKDKQQQRM